MARGGGSGRGGVTFHNLPVFKRRITDFKPKVDAVIAANVEYKGIQTLGHCKMNAPWTDRTTNARSGLGVEFEHVPGFRHGFAIYYSVPYGIFLELRWSGRFSIVIPTIKTVMPGLIGSIRAGIAALR